MEQMQFPPDFSEFLRLLNTHGVEYLLVGGFAVAIHGYPRATADLDVWVARTSENAGRLVDSLRAFGFEVHPEIERLFLEPDQIIRMGIAPIRIEILTTIDGVEFDDCRTRSIVHILGGSPVAVIGLDDLKANKLASGRSKDLADLDNLP